MRTVGRRQPSMISFAASATRLAEGARCNDEIHRLPNGSDSFIPKGVHRFKTHAEVNQHQMDCVAKGMASVARARQCRLMEQHSRQASFEDLKALSHAPNQNGAETIDLDGIPVRTLTLLLAKQSVRDKVVADRVVLERALAVLNAHPEKP